MRKSFDDCKELFMEARNKKNWNDLALWSTELLKFDRKLAWVWANRGEAYIKLGFPLDAILNLEKAIRYTEDAHALAIAHTNMGGAYWDLRDEAEAFNHLNRAINIDPLAGTYLTMGNIHKFNGDIQKALQCYRSSISMDPTNVDSHLVYGMALLGAGNLQEGWKEYEWRWKSDQLPPRKLKAPEWNGEDLTNKTILVYGEQGLGDILQFGRYIRVLANHFPRAKIIAEVRPPLKRLFETIPELYAVINIGEKMPIIDYGIAMLTLAGRLTPNLGAIPSNEQEYLLRDADIEVWAERFEQLPEGIKIGVCWSGMNRSSSPEASAVDAVRSTELSTFSRLAKIPGIIWVSLQKGPLAEQIRDPFQRGGMAIAEFGEEMYDFYETCCAARNCDLVISVDTAVAHAAASVGCPTWLLSRWDGCWRWFGTREDSPWYPTLRQFTQPAPGDWTGMMDKVAVELSKLVKSKTSPELDLTLAK